MAIRLLRQQVMAKHILESARIIRSLSKQVVTLDVLAQAMIRVLKSGGKILTAGNGGSAAEALHMAEELTGRFRSNRRSLPGIALVADATALTCIGNDFGFDFVFSRQVEGLGKSGDLLVLFSTSGSAKNLLEAYHAARRLKILTMAVLGRDGGLLKGRADYEMVVPGRSTERIQEAHQVILHILLDAVEQVFI